MALCKSSFFGALALYHLIGTLIIIVSLHYFGEKRTQAVVTYALFGIAAVFAAGFLALSMDFLCGV